MSLRSTGASSSLCRFNVVLRRADVQTLFHRRIRDRMCYIGERLPQPHSIVRNCPCGEEDFEWSVILSSPFRYSADSFRAANSITDVTPLELARSSKAPLPFLPTNPSVRGSRPSGTIAPPSARSRIRRAKGDSRSIKALDMLVPVIRITAGSSGRLSRSCPFSSPVLLPSGGLDDAAERVESDCPKSEKEVIRARWRFSSASRGSSLGSWER